MGLFIICILLLGLCIIVERALVILKEERKIKAVLNGISFTPIEPSKTKKWGKFFKRVPFLAALHQTGTEEENPVKQILLLYEKNKNKDMESLEMKLNETVIKYLPKVEKRIGLVKLLAGISPLCGLLGTVIGMIITFQSITLFGTGDPKLMAGGISQALVTTMLGLICAIPLLLGHSFIFSRSQKVVQILEEQIAGLLAKKLLKEKEEK